MGYLKGEEHHVKPRLPASAVSTDCRCEKKKSTGSENTRTSMTSKPELESHLDTRTALVAGAFHYKVLSPSCLYDRLFSKCVCSWVSVQKLYDPYARPSAVDLPQRKVFSY